MTPSSGREALRMHLAQGIIIVTAYLEGLAPYPSIHRLTRCQLSLLWAISHVGCHGVGKTKEDTLPISICLCSGWEERHP